MSRCTKRNDRRLRPRVTATSVRLALPESLREREGASTPEWGARRTNSHLPKPTEPDRDDRSDASPYVRLSARQLGRVGIL